MLPVLLTQSVTWVSIAGPSLVSAFGSSVNCPGEMRRYQRFSTNVLVSRRTVTSALIGLASLLSLLPR